MITTQEAVPVNLRIGWGRLRPKCLQFLNGPKWFLFFLTIFSAIQGMTVGGITNVSLPTLEKRFQFESTHLGFIAGSDDISGIVLVCFVSFYGGYGNKIKWLGYGALLTGIGCITFVLPHLLIGPYDPLTKNGQPSLTSRSQQTQDLCYLRNTTIHPEKKTCFSGYGSNWYHLMIFSIAQMLMGAGTTPLYSLGPAYIDENVHPKAAPIYLGVWFAATLLGPGLGFIVGGSILSVYVDINLPKGVVLTPNDSRWIGAWWLGYFIGGCILITSSVGILAFPAQLPGTQEMREKAIKEGDLPSRDEKIQGKLKDILPATLKLLKNPTYIFNTVGLTVGSMWGIGIVTFIAKILILKFGVNPVMSGIVIGCVLIPGCVCGILLGGYLVRRFNLKESCKQSAKYCFIIKCIGIVGALVWLIPGCSEIKMAGITVPYHNSTLSTRSLSSTCNVACGCDLAERNPVCGSDNIVYFSPCQAGCKTTVKRGVYSNCSCIPPRFDERESRATAGYCDKGPGCKNVSYFLASFIVLILVVFVGGIPNKTVVLRSVPDNQRAYALGFQFVFQRAMGFLPGPMLIGFLFDSLCLLWGQSCNKRGSCQVYDIEQLSYRLTGFAFMFSFVSGFFYLLSWRLYKPNNNNEKALRETIFMKEDQDKELLNMETETAL